MKTEKKSTYNADAQKRYNAKTILFAVKYYPTDITDGKRLKQFLEQNGQSANSYLKSLIKKDLDEKNFYIDEDLKSDSNWLTGWAVTMEWWNNIIVKFV